MDQFTQQTEAATNVDETTSVPRYYSEKAVYAFSVLGGALFGSILMAINLKSSPTKKGVSAVLLFGVAYTVVQIIIMNFVPDRASSTLNIVFGLGAGLCIRQFFWQKYIGTTAVYDKRSVLVPALILIVLVLLVLLSFIASLNT